MTPQYSNGNVPSGLLVTFNSGYNDADGHWTHSLPPATYARHLALVARAARRTNGRNLRPGVGWTCYRPLFAQVFLKKRFGVMAADPGTSSHGLYWERRQCAAIDYGNWSEVYAGFGGRAAFAEDCRAVGLTPNMIVPARGYPDEPWHVIDLNPWSAVPAFAGVVVLPFNPTQPTSPSEEDDMFSDDDRALLIAVKAALLDGIPQTGFAKGRLDVILENTSNTIGRILPAGATWDQYQLLRSDTTAILAALGKLDTGGLDAVEVGALAAAIREGLGAEVASELAKRLTE